MEGGRGGIAPLAHEGDTNLWLVRTSLSRVLTTDYTD